MQSVLSRLVLGYRPLWGRSRALVGVELSVHSADPVPAKAADPATTALDIPHLLHTLGELWLAHSPPLLLAPQTPALLRGVLQAAAQPAGLIPPLAVVVPGAWLGDAALAQQVQAARARGVALVWRGEAAQQPERGSALATCFGTNRLLTLAPEDALKALQAGAGHGPLQSGHLYEGIPSRALADLCLDEQGARALIGWPQDDVLHSLRHQTLQPAHATLLKLLKAIEAEQSLDMFEDILGEDPLLAYRFLTYANSPALGLRSGIDSLRRALVMLGYGALLRWLSEQLPHASTEPDLQPVRQAMVLRARLTEQLVDAGMEVALRREVYLGALFSQLGELLREPLGTLLRRLPLSGRIYDAAVLQTGPYAPSLALASALEGSGAAHAAAVRALCKAHDLSLEDTNRALLRMLAGLQVAPSAPKT